MATLNMLSNIKMHLASQDSGREGCRGPTMASAQVAEARAFARAAAERCLGAEVGAVGAVSLMRCRAAGYLGCVCSTWHTLPELEVSIAAFIYLASKQY